MRSLSKHEFEGVWKKNSAEVRWRRTLNVSNHLGSTFSSKGLKSCAAYAVTVPTKPTTITAVAHRIAFDVIVRCDKYLTQQSACTDANKSIDFLKVLRCFYRSVLTHICNFLVSHQPFAKTIFYHGCSFRSFSSKETGRNQLA